MEQRQMEAGYMDSVVAVLNSLNEFMGFEIQLCFTAVVLVALVGRLGKGRVPERYLSETVRMVAVFVLGFVLQASLITYENGKDMFKAGLQLASMAVVVQYFIVPKIVQFCHWVVDKALSIIRSRVDKLVDPLEDPEDGYE